jgi:hypothetical protein
MDWRLTRRGASPTCDEPTAACSVLIGTVGSAGSYIPAAMIRGRIAIPDVDPKTWRSRGRKRKRAQPALASAIVTPAPMKKAAGSVDLARRSGRCA